MIGVQGDVLSGRGPGDADEDDPPVLGYRFDDPGTNHVGVAVIPFNLFAGVKH